MKILVRSDSFLVYVRLLPPPLFPSPLLSQELWIMCVSLSGKLSKLFLSPQFDMILGKLENDGSRKVG